MRLSGTLALVVATGLVAGCGGDGDGSDKQGAEPVTGDNLIATEAIEKPPPKPTRTKPGGRYNGNYEEAKVVCSLKSVAGIAADFNLPSSTPAPQVAARYARGYFPAGRRTAAYAGCLAGMRKRAG